MAQLELQSDEVDFVEIVSSVFNKIWLPLLFAIAGGAFFAWYSFNVVVPEYESSVRFELLSDERDAPLGGLAALSQFAGIAGDDANGDVEQFEARILSRPFVNSIYEEAQFSDDPLFNTFLLSPTIFQRFKNFVLRRATISDPTEIDYLEDAKSEMAKRIFLSSDDSGFIELRLRHRNPGRAEFLANLFVRQALDDMFIRKRALNRESLNYFAEELLQVRKDLDDAVAAVSNYAIGNDIQSASILARTSTQLSQLRSRLHETSQAIAAYRDLLATTPGEFNGNSFAERWPVSVSLEFRRLISWPSVASNWELPSKASLLAGIRILEEQNTTLKRTLSSLEEQARNSGKDALELSKLEREVEVQSAIYEAAIEQFEAQSIFSGFQRDSGMIIEEAIPPRKAVSPKKTRMTVLGVLLGFIVGAALAILLSFRTGVVHGEKTLRALSKIKNAWSVQRRMIPATFDSRLSPANSRSLQNIYSSSGDSQASISIVPLIEDPRFLHRVAVSFARFAGDASAETSILDLSACNLSIGVGEVSDDDLLKYGTKTKISKQVNAFKLDSDGRFLNRSFALKLCEQLRPEHGRLIIVCPSPSKGYALVKAAGEVAETIVVLAETGRTTRPELDVMKRAVSEEKLDETLLMVF